MAGLKALNPEAPLFLPSKYYYGSYSYSHFYHPTTLPNFSYFQYPFVETYNITTTTTTTTTPLYLEPVLQEESYVEVGEIETSVAAEKRKKKGCNKNHKKKSFWRRSEGKVYHHNKQEWRMKCFNNNQDFSTRNYVVQQQMPTYNATQQPIQRFPVVPVTEDGVSTTVMIRNIPNRYNREMLMDFLDDHCMMENQKEEKPSFVSAYDFLYLPIDFKNGVNKGYAFVNFTDPRAVWKFYVAAHNQHWSRFHSQKIREIAIARLQGKEELVKHFETIYFPSEVIKEEYLPVTFTPGRDGSGKEVNQSIVAGMGLTVMSS